MNQKKYGNNRNQSNPQGMTDRRSRDRRSERRSFFRDREVIADPHLKKRSRGDRDRKIIMQVYNVFSALRIEFFSNMLNQ